jgi:hypothetical protein
MSGLSASICSRACFVWDGLAHDLDLGVFREEAAELAPREPLIVDEQGLHGWSGSGMTASATTIGLVGPQRAWRARRR